MIKADIIHKSRNISFHFTTTVTKVYVLVEKESYGRLLPYRGIQIALVSNA